MVINLINKNTNLEGKLQKVGWDAWYGITPLDIYRVEGHVHSIGGTWGTNNYWSCKRGVNPNFDTLMEFNGSPCQWSFKIEEKNYRRNKWDENEILVKYKVEILRNNEVFYEFNANNIDYAISKTRLLLFEINEHPIPFHMIDYKKYIISKKIMWNRIPAIIVDYSINNDLVIALEPEYIIPERIIDNGDNYDEDDSYVIEDLFSNSITWFRE